MTDDSKLASRLGAVSPAGLAAALVGVALFAYFVQRAGIDQVAGGIRRLGWMFLPVVALGGLRLAVRAMAWLGCLEGAHRLTVGRALQAVVVGDTLGNLTPLSILIGEPAKALFVRDREPVSRTLPALAVENLFYTLSAALVIAGGALALVLRLRSANPWWVASVGLVGTLIVLVALGHVTIWRHVRVASSMLAALARRGLAPTVVSRWAAQMRGIEDRVYALYPRDPRRLLRLTAWELGFHGLAILEIYLVLALISDVRPTLLDAFVFESTNRFITVVFKVIPMRLGVDEAGTAAFAELLAYGTAAGVTLAIVRKARMLVWMAVGVLWLVGRGMSVRRAMVDAEATRVAASADTPTPPPGRRAVVVMARSPTGAPAPKTRLADALPTEHDRRRLYTAFLTDITSRCRTIGDVTLRVAYTPDGGPDGFTQAGIDPEELLAQHGADLGARERGVFEDLFRRGFSPVVMIGFDLPTLPTARVTEALDRLEADATRVVLGPAADGGYYLIGLATPPGAWSVPDLFRGIRWSSRWTCADTVAAAARCGRPVDLLAPWSDVDTAADLARLRTELDTPAGANLAPATTRVLKDLDGRSPAV